LRKRRFDQQRDVAGPFPQGKNVQVDDTEPAVEILGKQILLDEQAQVLVRLMIGIGGVPPGIADLTVLVGFVLLRTVPRLLPAAENARLLFCKPARIVFTREMMSEEHLENTLITLPAFNKASGALFQNSWRYVFGGRKKWITWILLIVLVALVALRIALPLPVPLSTEGLRSFGAGQQAGLHPQSILGSSRPL
jgi:hypothetical protein